MVLVNDDSLVVDANRSRSSKFVDHGFSDRTNALLLGSFVVLYRRRHYHQRSSFIARLSILFLPGPSLLEFLALWDLGDDFGLGRNTGNLWVMGGRMYSGLPIQERRSRRLESLAAGPPKVLTIPLSRSYDTADALSVYLPPKLQCHRPLKQVIPTTSVAPFLPSLLHEGIF